MCLWTPKLQNLPYKLRRYPMEESLELKVDSKENDLQNTHLSPPLRHLNPKLANQKRKLSPVGPRIKAQATLHLPHQWLVKCIKRHNKQLVAQHLYEPPVKNEPTLSSVMGMDEGTKNYSFDHIFAGSNPNVLVDKTKYARDGLKIAHTDSGANKESRADDISLKVKLEDLSDILKDIRSAFFTLDSPPDEPIIVSDKSEEEEEVARDKDTKATSHNVPKDTLVPPPTSPKSAQIQELMAQLTKLLVTSLKPELYKLLTSHDFASCLPTELKELPSKITGLSGEIKELQKHVRDMEIELPGDLKEIQTKLETFTSTISIQEKLKILDSLPSLLHKVTYTFNRFATMVENASGAISMNVPSTGKATSSPAEGEKNTKDADTNPKNELVDILGENVVTHYYKKKLLFDKYYDKMLKRKKNPKITKCEVLTKKGPITLKIYREDGSDEVILNLKLESLKLLQRQLSRYTWTLFLRSKDETLKVLKHFLKMIQQNLQAQVISVRTDRGTEFLNKTRNAYFKQEGIEHQTSIPRTPKQNGVVERQNRTLVDVA
ncbi:retrovirus-related pol polyprotein from transposon TNT 1-94 [Tanacetum coccineum]